MKNLFLPLKLMIPVYVLFNSCNINTSRHEKWKKEIMNTELDFCRMAQVEGIPKAFLAYAAEDVTVKRKSTIIKGKQALEESYKDTTSKKMKTNLTRTPDFVDVSKSGDMGYTYGKYIYSKTDSLGKTKVDSGIFHTVWRKQKDGTWKFVWD